MNAAVPVGVGLSASGVAIMALAATSGWAIVIAGIGTAGWLAMGRL